MQSGSGNHFDEQVRHVERSCPSVYLERRPAFFDKRGPFCYNKKKLPLCGKGG